jgi:asparagine synthase (glutamine-hydrolysing)
MCGVFGIVKKGEDEISDYEMSAMHKAQIHRGPDHFGYFNNKGVFLGNNRLSIIDLENGNQPFYSDDKKIAVLQNGEIFNYVELQSELKGLGVNFQTDSDTEVILRLFEKFGISMLEKLNGMFSITIFDKKNNKLYLIRDRFGQKPLFYFEDNNKFIYSSEIKSILELGVSTSVNEKALVSFLKYNFVAGKETIFKSIYNVDPGNYIELNLKDNTYREVKWWNAETEVEKISSLLTKDNRIELIRDTIIDSIRIRMRSDVEYSAFLSGGIDSSIIVSQMNKITTNKFNTFTIGFGNSKFDESKIANEVAMQMNVNHRCENFNDNILDYWSEVLKFTEQPHGDVSFIPMYLLSKFASEKDRVVLTGDGADELFGGYNKYFEIRDDSDLETQFIESSTLFSDTEIKMLLGGQISSSVNVIRELIQNDSLLSNSVLEGNQNKSMYLDTIFLLPYNNLIKPDRMGMAHSIELRSPFMDYRNVALAFALKAEDKIANNTSKYIIRQAFKEDIPESVFRRDKQKFIVPLNENKVNIERFYKIIINSDLDQLGITNEKFIENLYLNHTSGKINHYRELRALAALSLWYNIYSKFF